MLVVEGKDDELFFQALLTHLGLTSIQIFPIGGTPKLASNLKALKNDPNFGNVSVLAIIRDADTNAHTALQSVITALSNAALPTPAALGQRIGASPTVIIELLPGGLQPGMLEDLCIQSVSPSPIMSCTNQYVACLQTNGVALPQNLAKARLHSYLAMQPQPGKRLGEAALSSYWPFNNQAFAQIKSFLSSL